MVVFRVLRVGECLKEDLKAGNAADSAGPSGDGLAMFEDGAAAYDRGDYPTALRLLRPLPFVRIAASWM